MDENTILHEMSPSMGRRFAEVVARSTGSRDDAISAIVDKGIAYYERLHEAELQRKEDAKARRNREDFERYLSRNPKEAQEAASDPVKLLNLLSKFGLVNANMLNAAAANAQKKTA